MGLVGFYLYTDHPSALIDDLNQMPFDLPYETLGITTVEQPLKDFFEKAFQFRPYTLVFFMLLAILSMVILSYSALVIHLDKEVAVRKLSGQSSGFISRKMYFRLNLLLGITFLAAIMISLLITVKHWNALSFTYVLWLSQIVGLFLITIALANVVTYYFIYQNRPHLRIKQSGRFQPLLTTAWILKTLVVVVIVSQILSLLPLTRDLWYILQAEKQFQDEYISAETHLFLMPPMEDNLARNALVVDTYEAIQKTAAEISTFAFDRISLGSTYITGVDENGEPIMFDSEHEIVMLTTNTFRHYEVIDSTGQKILYEESPSDIQYLVPEGTEAEGLEKYHPALTDGVQVSIKPGQDLLLPDGRFSRQPIIVIMQPELMGRGLVDYFANTPQNRKLFQDKMAALGFDESMYEFVNMPESPVKKHLILDIQRNSWILLFTLTSYLMLSYFMVQAFVRSHQKRLILGYLHGSPTIRRYRKLWFYAITPYILGWLMIILQPKLFSEMLRIQRVGIYIHLPEVSLLYTVLCLGILCLFDLGLYVGFIKNLQGRSVLALKGDV